MLGCTGSVSFSVAITVSVTIPISVSITAAAFIALSTLPFFVSFFSLKITLSLALFLLFFSFPSSLVALRLAFDFSHLCLSLFSFAFFFFNPLLLFLNSSFFLSQFLSYTFAFVSSGLCICFVLEVGLCTPRAFALRCLFADLVTSDLANAAFDGIDINQLCNNIFGLLVNARSFEGAINQCSGLATVQSQELLGVAFDFLFGYFENRFGNLCFIVLLHINNWSSLR